MIRETKFGEAVRSHLAASSTTQLDLADAIDVSPSYLNQVVTGRKRPSADWVDLVADALQLDERRRVDLHRAAARDLGFKLDLTK